MKQFDPASFKDPAGRVYSSRGRIFRELTPAGEKIWKDLKDSGLAEELVKDGLLAKTWETSDPDQASGFVLEHETLPTSYAYEWPPSMLRDAALLHLRIMERLLPRGFILKDATPYNVLFRGVRPRFIDVLSIERWEPGDIWAGYGSFCDTMLYPLMLHAYKGVPYHDWLRGALNGIKPESFAKLFGWADLLKPGILAHVDLRARLHERFRRPGEVRRADIKKAALPASAILRNIAGLISLIEGLPRREGKPSAWCSYPDTNTYDQAAREKKRAFVDRSMASLKPRLLWDIGCNMGELTRVAAPHCELVVALDSDLEVVDALAEECRRDGVDNILPLVQDFCNPSPGMGWACTERKSLFGREKPDAVMALAVVHHLAVRGGVPLEEQLRLFAETAPHALIEFVDRDDPMFVELRSNMVSGQESYSTGEFKRCVSSLFETVETCEAGKTRELYLLRAKR